MSIAWLQLLQLLDYNYSYYCNCNSFIPGHYEAEASWTLADVPTVIVVQIRFLINL